MKIRYLFFILTIVVSVDNYDNYHLKNVTRVNIGDIFTNQTFSFYVDAASGQSVEIGIFTNSTGNETNNITFYAYIESQTNYYEKATFNLTRLEHFFYIKVIINPIKINEEEYILINHLTFNFTPVYNMENTSIVAVITGNPFTNTIDFGPIIIVMLLPIICCIICIILCLCCCCKKSPPPINYQNPDSQPLYPVDKSKEQSSGDVTP